MKDSYTRVTNLSYLREASAGNEGFIKEMIGIFLRQTPEFIEQLTTYGQDQNWPEFRKVMHKLKPTVYMMGIHSMQPVIKQIEQCSKELKNIASLPGLLDDLSLCCQKAYIELGEEIREYNTDS